jgi:hypothetical protein
MMESSYQKRCICKMCPSYVNCGELVAYCLPEIDSSKCIKVKSGCVCPGCPVYEEKGFSKDYYCIPENK